MKIYLTRHGRSRANEDGIFAGVTDTPLTELGWRQAIALGIYMKGAGITIDVAYCSQLSRAVETAEVLQSFCGVHAVKRRALNERNFGELEGKAISTIQTFPEEDLLRTDGVTYVLRAEGMEFFEQLRNRVYGFLGFLKEHHAKDTVLLVCHGDVGKMLYACFYHLDWRDVLRKFHFGNCGLILLEEGCPEEKRILYNPDGHSAI